MAVAVVVMGPAIVAGAYRHYGETTITGDQSKQDQILLSKNREINRLLYSP